MPNPAPAPSGPGCKRCTEQGGWWFHLRRCVVCGQIGCCDQSPKQHARQHWQETGHPFLTTYEPEPIWLYDWRVDADSEQPIPELLPPRHHPLDQPTPGSAGRVPDEWMEQLNG